MMKKILLSALLASTALTFSAQAKSFDLKLEQECRYILGDRDNGRYDDEAHGFSLGVVAGIKNALPANRRNGMYKKTLGYISDRACDMALRDRSGKRFIYKYQKAAMNLMTRR